MQKVEEKMIRGSPIAIVLYDMTNGLILSVVKFIFHFQNHYHTPPFPHRKTKENDI